jgi:hypothetical protein
VPEGAAEAYEALRPYLLEPSGHNGSVTSRVFLLRRGMLAWACERNHTWAYTSLPISSQPVAASSLVPRVFATELVRLMAGLILSKQKESGLCLN